jgi:hypothetical protein
LPTCRFLDWSLDRFPSWTSPVRIRSPAADPRRSYTRSFERDEIAIDEISIGHGHRYLTVVLNLETGAVVFVGDGKGAVALEPFWKRLKAARARIEAVATDISKPWRPTCRWPTFRRSATTWATPFTSGSAMTAWLEIYVGSCVQNPGVPVSAFGLPVY